MAQEKLFWEDKVKLLENAENIRYVLTNEKRKNVSFYEGFAVLLSNGYLDSELSQDESGYSVN